MWIGFLCQQNEVLCIADEVMTGFGKTGKNFASEYMTHQPDIICLSKALTAGMLPMSITSCSQKVFDAFLDEQAAKGFFHAHTYSANPLGCAVAIAGIELLLSEEIQNDMLRITQAHQKFADRIKTHVKVREVRTMGVIFALELAVEMERYGATRNQLFDYFMKEGVFLRPLGKVVYILPPYVTSNMQLQKIYTVIEKSLSLL